MGWTVVERIGAEVGKQPPVVVPHLAGLIAGAAVFAARLPLLDTLRSSHVAAVAYYLLLVLSPFGGIMASIHLSKNIDQNTERNLKRAYGYVSALGMVLVVVFVLSGSDGLVPRSSGGEVVGATLVAVGLLVATAAIPILYPLARLLISITQRARTDTSR